MAKKGQKRIRGALAAGFLPFFFLPGLCTLGEGG